jgi:hypothetical protein
MAVAQATDEIAYIDNPRYKGVLRPYLSNKGPYNNCPKDIPIKKEDKESITEATVVFKPFAILGKAGKYMSIDKGPMADNKPKIRIK